MPGPIGGRRLAARALLMFALMPAGWPPSSGMAFADEAAAARESVTSPTAAPAERAEARRELRNLEHQAIQLAAKGKLMEAIAAGEKGLRLASELDGPLSKTAAAWQQRLAPVYERREDWPAARTARGEVLAILSKQYGEKDWRVVDARLVLADVEIRSRLTADERRELLRADQEGARASALYRHGDFRRAIQLAEHTRNVRRRLLGEQHRGYAQGLNNLAALYKSQGDYAKAEPLYQQALAIRKKALGEAHPAYAGALQNLADLYAAQADYANAEPLFRRALEIWKNTLGEAHPNYAKSLNNLAALYDSQGDYAKAEPLYRQALAIRKKFLGIAHPDYAQSLSNLASLYDSQGDYAKAESLYRQVLELRKKVLGEAHPDYATSLNNLAASYQSQGDSARALPLLRQALAIRKKILGEAHPDYALSLHNLAFVYQSQADYAKAEPLYRQAMDVWKNALGEAHPLYATNLNNLALVYRNQGDDAEAEPLLRQALAIRKKSLGEAHPDYAQSLNNLAFMYQSQGDSAKAEPLYRQALAIYEKHFANTLQIQSERQQLAFAESLRWHLDAYVEMSAENGTSPLDVYRHVLAWKGAIFMRQAAERALRQRADLKPQFDELASLNVRLSTRALRGPGQSPPTVWERQVAELSDRKESLERELSAKSTEFRDQRALRDLKPEDLQQALPQKAALVDVLEYWKYRPSNQKRERLTPERRLTAFIVRHDRPITRIELGSSRSLVVAARAWRRAIERDRGSADEVDATRSDAALKPPQQTLREAVWDPLHKALEGAEIVLISPDGVLNQIPLAALPGQKPGSYLVEETKLAILPVPRLLPMLLRTDEHEMTKDESLLIVGDVSYGGSPGQAEGIQVATRSAIRGARSGGLEFAELAYSRSEMATIRHSFEKNFSDGKTKTLRGTSATETAFRREAPHYRWLHLATHGFFAPSQIASALTAAKEDKDRGFGEFGRRGLSGYHPGLLSGVALSGANTPAGADDDDGILTAVEVGVLDLERADLVVLSACETGLGAVAGGEGVLGLQRAFQLSGAKTTVASLWKIPDQATSQLMKHFYENLWDKKLSKLDALREAQLSMLNGAITREGRRRGLDLEDSGTRKPTSARLPPRYWAAFVLSGDWR